MARLLKWVIRITGAALLLGLIAVGVFYMLLSRSLPDYDKSLAVSGLTAPVEIVRDNANVPHVFAASDRDAYFGLGYAHAQDRLVADDRPGPPLRGLRHPHAQYR